MKPSATRCNSSIQSDLRAVAFPAAAGGYERLRARISPQLTFLTSISVYAYRPSVRRQGHNERILQTAIAGPERSPTRPFLDRTSSAPDCSPLENFSIPLTALTCSFVRHLRPVGVSHGINYPRAKPRVVARGHSREPAGRYTRMSRPYTKRVSVPSNLRVATSVRPGAIVREADARRTEEDPDVSATGAHAESAPRLETSWTRAWAGRYLKLVSREDTLNSSPC